MPNEDVKKNDYWRPKTRNDCRTSARPCPFVLCEYHLYLDVHPVSGTIQFNWPDVEVEDMNQLFDTCALDAAEMGGMTLEEVGDRMNFCRERSRQVEAGALNKLRERLRKIKEDKDE